MYGPATAHGHQGDTVDVGLAVVNHATSHRSLYVGATRGRQENRLLVVTEDSAPEAALEALERVLANDRADVPAVVQRRDLARQVPRARTAEDGVTVARRNHGEVRRSAWASDRSRPPGPKPEQPKPPCRSSALPWPARLGGGDEG